jgi:hypothetical protein
MYSSSLTDYSSALESYLGPTPTKLALRGHLKEERICTGLDRMGSETIRNTLKI